ncbi:MAG: hypothetical protein HY543_10630 [Deltaproteobacteria bacterium]|nr:hypothetical protein [Deltaproteobacteria bacterium]
MSLNFRSAKPAEPVGYDDIGLRANWDERIVVVSATCMAVLIVALIAVLMGMA